MTVVKISKVTSIYMRTYRDHLDNESERGEAEELVASSLSWEDNLVLHVLRGERLQIPLVFFFVGFNLELAIDEQSCPSLQPSWS